MTSPITELKLLRERYEYWRDEYKRTGSQKASILYHERFKAYCSYIDRHQIASSDLEVLAPHTAPTENPVCPSVEPSGGVSIATHDRLDRKKLNEQILDLRVLSILQDHQGFLGTRAISAAVDRPIDSVRQSLYRLLSLKKIEVSGSVEIKPLWQVKR